MATKLGCGVEARREQRVAKKGQRRRRGEWAPVRALAESSPAQTLAGGVAAAAVSVAAVLEVQPDSAPAAVQQQQPQPGPCVLQKCNRELLGCLSDEKCTGALSPPAALSAGAASTPRALISIERLSLTLTSFLASQRTSSASASATAATTRRLVRSAAATCTTPASPPCSTCAPSATPAAFHRSLTRASTSPLLRALP